MREKVVERVIDALCEHGCGRVLEEIDALERGEMLPETRGLEPSEVRRVLQELKAVMAVYGNRCSV